MSTDYYTEKAPFGSDYHVVRELDENDNELSVHFFDTYDEAQAHIAKTPQNTI